MFQLGKSFLFRQMSYIYAVAATLGATGYALYRYRTSTSDSVRDTTTTQFGARLDSCPCDEDLVPSILKVLSPTILQNLQVPGIFRISSAQKKLDAAIQQIEQNNFDFQNKDAVDGVGSSSDEDVYLAANIFKQFLNKLPPEDFLLADVDISVALKASDTNLQSTVEVNIVVFMPYSFFLFLFLTVHCPPQHTPPNQI